MTVPEGITYFDEIGMVDLGMDGTVLFPGAVAPQDKEYTLLACLTNPNPTPETVSDGPASVALYTSDQDSDTYVFDGGPVRVTGAMVPAADASTPRWRNYESKALFSSPGRCCTTGTGVYAISCAHRSK